MCVANERGVLVLIQIMEFLVPNIVRDCQQHSYSGFRTAFTQMIILNLLIKTKILLIATAAFQVHSDAQAVRSR